MVKTNILVFLETNKELIILSQVVPLTMGKMPLPPIQRGGSGVFLVEEVFNDELRSFSSSPISSTSLEQQWVQEEGRRRSWVYQGRSSKNVWQEKEVVLETSRRSRWYRQ